MLFVKADESIRNLVDCYRNGELILSPSFQRGYVWNIKQASRLIESVLMSIPLPSIYLNEVETSDDKSVREVIDGKQRTTTLIYYVLGRSPIGENRKFKLISKYPELNGRTFQDLPSEFRKKIYATKIRTTEIPCDIDPELKYSLFERINVGSVALNPQEIRNCVSRGEFNDWLNETATSSVCDRIMGDMSKTSRMERQETLLKLCCIQSEWNGLGSFPIVGKQKLDSFMRLNANRTEKELEYITKPVLNALRKTHHVMGSKAFDNIRKGFDARSLLVVASWLSINNNLVLAGGLSDRIRTAFEAAKEQQEYISASTSTKCNLIYDFLNTTLSDQNITLDPVRFFSRSFSLKLYENSEHKLCEICQNKIMSFEDCQTDHRIAWSNGGRTNAENAQLSHILCNQQKSNKAVHDA